ncbi:MAG: hypothetical protein ACHP6H_05835, partial [Legionellales bacterium]
MQKITFSEDETNDIIQLYSERKSCHKISKIFRCSKQVINGLLKDNGIEVRDQSHCQQIYAIDEDVFETIDSHEKAYWLGMLAGDGCVSTKGDVNLSLQEKDKTHIYLYKNFLKSDHKIHIINNGLKNDGSYSISHCISITNSKLVSDLKLLGITPNKTLYMEFP